MHQLDQPADVQETLARLDQGNDASDLLLTGGGQLRLRQRLISATELLDTFLDEGRCGAQLGQRPLRARFGRFEQGLAGWRGSHLWRFFITHSGGEPFG